MPARFASIILGLSASVSLGQPAEATYQNTLDIAKLLSSDCRMVVMGDSFASSVWTAVFPSFLFSFDAAPLTAIQTGANGTNEIALNTLLATPSISVNAVTPTGYEVFTKETMESFYALPIRGPIEFYGSPQLALGTNGSIMSLGVNYEQLRFAAGGPPWVDGDTVGFRACYLAPDSYGTLHESLTLRADGLPNFDFNPYTDARPVLHLGGDPNSGLGSTARPGQTNAVDTDLAFTVWNKNLNAGVVLASTTGTIDTGTYVVPTGGVFYKIDPTTGLRARGLYYSTLADVSWSYTGFAKNIKSRSRLDKTFSIKQLVHWLDATTLDPNQPVVFVYYLAVETSAGKAVTAERIEGMIDQSQSAASVLNLGTVRHLLVLPHFHQVYGVDDSVVRQRFQEQRDIMFEIASRRPEVGAVSIYDATGRIKFDGTQQAADWLSQNENMPFEYADQQVDLAGPDVHGELLDIYRLHPASRDAAAYFGSKFVEALFAQNPIDFNNDRVIDSGDISLFVQLFLQNNSLADLNGDGVVDNGDISTFVALFLAET